MSGFDDICRIIEAHMGADGRAVAAMSGGVDSALTAAAAFHVAGDRACGVTVQSEFVPDEEVRTAQSVATAIGIEHDVSPMTLLETIAVRRNGPDRCYHCKGRIFAELRARYGEALFLDGTNADDDPARPGLRALAEYGVASPLREAGMTKEAVRRTAREIGLPNWNRPSESCLAARLPVGVALSPQAVRQVAVMEAFWRECGVETLRAGHDNLVASVSFMPKYAEIIEQKRDVFAALIKRIGLRSCVFEEWTP